MQTRDAVVGLHNFWEFSQVFRRGYVNTEKVLCCFYKIILKNTRQPIKSVTIVFTYSHLNTHLYQPMRACVVSQLYYKGKYGNANSQWANLAGELNNYLFSEYTHTKRCGCGARHTCLVWRGETQGTNKI